MKGYVIILTGSNAGDIYVQLPNESQWGFCLADDDSTWDGGFGLLENGGKWELMDDNDPRITPEVRDRLEWLLE